MDPQDVPVDSVHVRSLRMQRDVDASAIDRLKQSIEERGLLHPITVLRLPAGDYELVAGLHRLEAMKQLGRPTISALVLNADEDDARLLSIEENLARATLSEAATDEAIAMWQELWEAKHGPAKRGRPPKNDAPRTSFAQMAAARTGRSVTSITRAVGRVKRLGPEAAQARAAGRIGQGQADELASLSEEEQRRLLPQIEGLGRDETRARARGAATADKGHAELPVGPAARHLTVTSEETPENLVELVASEEDHSLEADLRALRQDDEAPATDGNAQVGPLEPGPSDDAVLWEWLERLVVAGTQLQRVIEGFRRAGCSRADTHVACERFLAQRRFVRQLRDELDALEKLLWPTATAGEDTVHH